MDEAEAIVLLDRFESHLYQDLYLSRWSKEHATEVVPELRRCFHCEHSEILRRTLSALGRIGPEAQEAEAEVVALIDHDMPIVREAAVWTLGRICLRRPERAVPRLIEAARDDTLLKPSLFALIGFGPDAIAAIPLLLRTFESTDGRLRLLALRGIKEVHAEFDRVESVLRRGLVDRSKDVRRSTEKLIAGKWPTRLAELHRSASTPVVTGEEAFDDAITASIAKLVGLATEAMEEDRAGETEDLDPEAL